MQKARVAQPSLPVLYALAVALFTYGWLSLNIYLPILSQLERVFGATSASARLTATVFLLGFSFSQLIWGPLSDRFGRRPMLLCGLALSVAGALLTSVVGDIVLFAGARFFESVGLGAAPVVVRSLLTDRLDRPQVAIAMAYATSANAVVPALAPLLGGYLDLLFGWRGLFVFLALYGALLFALCVLRLPETNARKNPALRARQVASEYLEILRNGRYVGYISAYGLAYGTLVGYYVAAPYIFVRELGYHAHEYGYLLILNVAFYVLGATLSRLLTPRLGIDLPIAVSVVACASATAVLFVLNSLTGLDTLSVLLPMSLFLFGAGLVSPAANAGAMTIFKDKAGAATAVIGFSIALGGALFSGALSAFRFKELWELTAYVGVSTLLSCVVYVTLIRRGERAEARQES